MCEHTVVTLGCAVTVCIFYTVMIVFIVVNAELVPAVTPCTVGKGLTALCKCCKDCVLVIPCRKADSVVLNTDRYKFNLVCFGIILHRKTGLPHFLIIKSDKVEVALTVENM